jgi:uridine kinase
MNKPAIFIGVDGEPGVGKTYFSKKILESIDGGEVINVSGMSHLSLEMAVDRWRQERSGVIILDGSMLYCDIKILITCDYRVIIRRFLACNRNIDDLESFLEKVMPNINTNADIIVPNTNDTSHLMSIKMIKTMCDFKRI